MASVNVSPRGNCQIDKRNAFYKTRGASPTFREVLRDRCHLRIKARRSSLFEQFRNMKGNDELRRTLSDMLHEEIDVLMSEEEKPIEFEGNHQCLETDNKQEYEDKWIIEEYENILAEEEALYSFDWDKEVICPLCEKAVLKQDDDATVKCNKCKVELPKVKSLIFLRDSINSVLLLHQQSCKENAQFALIHDGSSNGLYLICHFCSFFLLV